MSDNINMYGYFLMDALELKNIVSDAISGGKPTQLSENAAKLFTRMTLGFPTAIGRSMVEGAKRFSLGAPTFVKALRTEDPQARAILIKEGIKRIKLDQKMVPLLLGLMCYLIKGMFNCSDVTDMIIFWVLLALIYSNQNE